VPVELPGEVEVLVRHVNVGAEAPEQLVHHVAPCLHVPLLEYGLPRLLRSLLGREAGPLVVPAARRVASQLEISPLPA
jgi:hypothetical protein